MPTSSFDKTFIVSDPEAIEKICQSLENPRVVYIQRRDFDLENIKGIELLKKRLKMDAHIEAS